MTCVICFMPTRPQGYFKVDNVGISMLFLRWPNIPLLYVLFRDCLHREVY